VLKVVVRGDEKSNDRGGKEGGAVSGGGVGVVPCAEE